MFIAVLKKLLFVYITVLILIIKVIIWFQVTNEYFSYNGNLSFLSNNLHK